MPAKLAIRPLKHIGSGVVEVALTRGRVALIDEIDAERVSVCNWYLKTSHKTFYAIGDPNGSTRKDISTFMHTFLFGKKGMCVDHINRDGLDNRRANVRLVSHAQNIQNSVIEGCTSKYKGVYWHANRWEVCLSKAGRKVYGGRFASELDAAIKADSIILDLWGPFACTNASLGLLPVTPLGLTEAVR